MRNSAKKTQTDSISKKANRKGKRFFSNFCMIFLLFIIAGAAFLGWQEIEQLKKTITHLSAQDDVKGQIEQLKLQIKGQGNDILKLQTQIENNEAKRKKLKNEYEKELVFSFIQTAEHYLKLEKNTKGAVLYLNKAKQVAKKINEKSWDVLSQKIQNTINSLEQLKLPNVFFIVKELRRLNEKIQSMELKKSGIKQENSQEKTAKENNIWEEGKNKIMESLKKAVIIKKRTGKNRKVLIPDSQYVSANLNLLFLQAQWSVLDRKEEDFKNDLEEIRWILEHYFEKTEALNKIILKINTLQSINLSPVMPDLFPLLKMSEKLLFEEKYEKKQPSEDQKDILHEVLPS